MDLDSARGELIEEARDLLGTIETGLLQLEQDGVNDEVLHSVFRAAHTLKGSAGIFGLETLVHFTHTLENLLDALRSGTLVYSPEIASTLLAGKDLLMQMIDELENGSDDPDPDPRIRNQIQEQLLSILPGRKARHSRTGKNADEGIWHLSLRLDPECLRNGMDPLALFDHLKRFGKIVHMETLTSGIPAPGEMNAELLYMGFEIGFATAADRSRIESVFELVREHSTIHIIPPVNPIEEELQTDPLCLQSDPIRNIQKENTPSSQNVNTTPEQHNLNGMAELKRPAEHRYVKVEVEKLDALINQVGELVIAGAAAGNQSYTANAELQEAIANVQKLIEGVRDASLSLRMVPIGEVFQRFPRVVRDISRSLGKSIQLQMDGAETELDKSMVERLVDPLTHMIRNAIDHGIESVEKRLAAGKPATGTVRLNAWHEGSNILIEISDDGAGIDTEKVLVKAVEKGLIRTGAEPGEHEIRQLIFEAGFSTADSVTSLSGRGVGMDVVKKNIDGLRGSVEVESQSGLGSRFRIRLPLTLAIINGFQFRAGESNWVVPLDQVVECTDLSMAETYQGIVRLRGEPLSFFRLRDLYHIEGKIPSRESLVVVQYGNRRLGIAVDSLIGELQAVIKPLGKLFRGLRGIGGTTILGNGQLALILDVGQLATISEELQNAIVRS